MQTASTSGARTTSRQSACTRATPNSRATRSPDSLVRLATATSSTPGSSLNPGMCRRRVLLPAPTKPTRIVVSVIARMVTRDRLSSRSPARRPLAADEVGSADQRGADGLALVGVRERLVDPLEREPVRHDRAEGIAVVRALEELEPAPERPRLVAADAEHAAVLVNEPRGVERDRLVGGAVADDDVAALGARHREPLGECCGMADQLHDDVTAAARQLADGLRPRIARGEVVHVQRVVGAEGLREREALGDPVEDDDARGAALARNRAGEEAEP